MGLSKLSLLQAGLLVLLPAAALADAVSLAGDAYFTPGNAGHFGSTVSINVGGVAGNQGLLQFDLSQLPPGKTSADVTSASLRIFINRVSTPGGVDIYAASGAWQEGTVNGTGSPTPGASVALNVGVSVANAYLVIPVTAQVQAWMDGGTNNGFLLAPHPAITSISIDSKESQATSHPAVLEVNFAAPAGPQGSAGAVGPGGPQGPQGAIGLIGNAGPAGPAGTTGPVGAAGDTGPVGAAGPAGPQGATGVIGPAGPIGPMGLQGDTGPAGIAGVTGPVGIVGPAGPQGPQGAAGPQGTAGAQGPTGPKGATGPQGATGATGPAGSQGTTGPPGARAPQGARGATGATGPAGPTGSTGPAGLINNTFAILTTPLTPGTISNSETRNVLLINNTSGSFVTVTLPQANVAGKVLTLIGSDLSTAGNSMLIKPQGSDKILTFSSIVTSGSGSYQANFWVQVVSDGTGVWRIVAGQ